MLLAFDTATHAVTVALHTGTADGEVVASSTVVDALRHGELLAPGIQRVLVEAGCRPRDLTAIAVGVGPGPFTGLRVGIMTARTMAAVLEIPVRGVCTLDVVAAAVSDQAGGFRVATDARRKEVYWAAYDGTGRRTTAPAVDRPDDVFSDGPVAGRGALLYPDAFPHPIEPENPAAADLARLVAAGAVEVLPPEPLYLRRPDAATPGRPKRVL
jgi:tRNA threonylcarbamoyl adenosine modification protein YeaZ